MSPSRKKQARAESDRPSLFFIILLIAGLILLAWLFVRGVTSMKPADGTPPASTQTQT